ncbi:MAG: phosphoribosylamine--glycine ligase [Verrucomicrobiae bacterium]|nr:phosphoribosylamine--glycine ligase [Verrucomicrobiae bacterium]
MKLLIIGSGGREHALLWKLKQNPRITECYVAPGNAGTGTMAINVPIEATNIAGLLQFAQEKKIDLTIVGPDDPLAAGIVDQFQQAGLRIFGPTAAAARFEASKSFAKDFMKRHGIPTAASETFTSSEKASDYVRQAKYPLVVKADGLALGKGVIIAQSAEEALTAIKEMMEEKVFGAAGETVVIEEFLTGPECSLHALIDGKNYLLFPDARDHKRALDGDQGLNTGGMGTISPSGLGVTKSMRARLHYEIFVPFLSGLADEKIKFQGMLFPGLIITKDGPKVLEFNARFGDPETQVLMRRLYSDLLELLEATIDGKLDTVSPWWDERPAVCVVLASGGYPGPIEKGKPITGFENVTDPNVVVFHAGTKQVEENIVTNGGRVLGVTALGRTLEEARQAAYAAADQIQFEGKQLRRDIGELKFK